MTAAVPRRAAATPAPETRPVTTASPDSPHISQIPTLWTVVRQAHGDEASDAGDARKRLLDQYGGAVRRYLLAMLRDADAADDVMQEFALRLLRGDFRNADPDKGRFRAFVKTTVYRLVMDHHRGRKRAAREGPMSVDPAGDLPDETASDEAFVESWRSDLLDRAWRSLESDAVAYAVLRTRVDHPELRSAELPPLIEQTYGQTVKPNSVRVYIQRARERFAGALLAAVRESVDGREGAVEEELIDLRLLEYCRPALEKGA